jgi:Uncharacterized protein conserved in bacteria (DUF2330)
VRRSVATTVLALVMIGAVAVPALACAGLVAPNGSVRLLRTSTLAGYHNGIEHYITSFEFQGGGAKFGSIVPLPGLPDKNDKGVYRVTRAGKWTLQRLQRETQPQPVPAAEDSGSSADGGGATEVYETEIDGLLITILEGGSRAVGKWAKDEGFALTPDAPEVLRFYAQRSKIFMAVRFVPEKAKKRKLETGDGVPIHLRIPTDNPWVPLRILALGKKAKADVDADVYLLTDIEPALLPAPVAPGERGLVLERSEQASDDLLDDIRDDRGMHWVPEESWLTYLRVDSNARKLTYDLAIDASGAGTPSEEDAYGKQSDEEESTDDPYTGVLFGLAFVAPLGLGFVRVRRSSKPRR